MKVVIGVFGGVAEVEENEHELSVMFVDHDEEKDEPSSYDVLVSGYGGVWEVSSHPEGVDVTVVDYDEVEENIERIEKTEKVRFPKEVRTAMMDFCKDHLDETEDYHSLVRLAYTHVVLQKEN